MIMCGKHEISVNIISLGSNDIHLEQVESFISVNLGSVFFTDDDS